MKTPVGTHKLTPTGTLPQPVRSSGTGPLPRPEQTHGGSPAKTGTQDLYQGAGLSATLQPAPAVTKGLERASGDKRKAVRQVQEMGSEMARAIVSKADAKIASLRAEAEALANRHPDKRAALMSQLADRIRQVREVARQELRKLNATVNQECAKILAKKDPNIFQKWGQFLVNLAKGAMNGLQALEREAGEAIAKVGAMALERIIDPALDRSVLGHDNEYTDEATGAFGDLLTNRLAPGESVWVKADANATLLGVPLAGPMKASVTAGGGAMVEIKRVPALDAQGNPRTSPLDSKGRPPTELQIRIVTTARAGAEIKAKLGTSVEKQGLGGKVTSEAAIAAKASVSVQGRAEFTFRFDPRNPAQVADMTGIFSSVAKAGLEAAIPGIGPILAANNADDIARDARRFGQHLSEVRVVGGVQGEAGAHVGASTSVSRSGTAGDGIAGQAINRATDAALEDARVQGFAAGGSAGFQAEIGYSNDLVTGRSTQSFRLTARSQAYASAAGGVGGGAGTAMDRTLEVIRDRSGRIVAVQVTDTGSKDTFMGLGHRDALQTRVDSNLLAQVGHGDRMTVVRSLPPALLQRLQQGQLSPMDLAGMLASAEATASFPIADVRSTRSSSSAFGANLGVVDFHVEAGHAQERDLDG